MVELNLTGLLVDFPCDELLIGPLSWALKACQFNLSSVSPEDHVSFPFGLLLRGSKMESHASLSKICHHSNATGIKSELAS
jgi:hypothetical protein